MPFPEDFYEYLGNNTLTGIKGGFERPGFLDIWMVEVDGRVFARSWGKSARSWFSAFLATGAGEIRYGDRVIGVKGRQLTKDPHMNARIDRAYLEKYTQEENVYYAKGITQPEYADYTMEFLYDG